MNVIQPACDGIGTGTATNGTATATIAAPGVGFFWRVKAWGASFSGAAVATPVRASLTVGANTLNFGVSTAVAWAQEFEGGFDGADNGAISISLLAGGVGAVGDVYVLAVKTRTGQGV